MLAGAPSTIGGQGAESSTDYLISTQRMRPGEYLLSGTQADLWHKRMCTCATPTREKRQSTPCAQGLLALQLQEQN